MNTILYPVFTILFCFPLLQANAQNSHNQPNDTLAYTTEQANDSLFLIDLNPLDQKKYRALDNELNDSTRIYKSDFEYPVFANPNRLAVIDSLNWAVSVGCYVNLSDTFYATLTDARRGLAKYIIAENIVEGEADNLYLSSFENEGIVEVYYQTKSALTVRDYNFYWTRPSVDWNWLMFDPTTGKRLTLANILKPQKLADLTQKAEFYFDQQMKVELDSSEINFADFKLSTFGDSGFELPNNMALVREGLTLSFYAHPYRHGNFDVVVPYYEICDYLKEEYCP